MPSSVIRHYNYDAASKALTVDFVTGRRYCYAEVPPEAVIQLGAAASKGRYFNQHIRNRYPSSSWAGVAERLSRPPERRKTKGRHDGKSCRPGRDGEMVIQPCAVACPP